MQKRNQNLEPKQCSLPLDYTPALESEMRTLFECRWRRWHSAPSFEVAVADPVTKRLLALAVQHLPSNVGTRR